jgi:putative transposase
VVSAPARRELVRHMVSRGLSERRSLRVIGMSASALRYEPVSDRNCALKEKIIALAQRHRRYGAGMTYLKLRQAGEIVNHKRVDRLYAQAGLQVKKRKRKKIPLAERHPLERPMAANQAWSMDFVFDRTAEGSCIKNLTVVDDATHEAVVIVPERAMGGNLLVHILDHLATKRGLPKAIRTDNAVSTRTAFQ